ncbi:cellulase family glycosylhydrolase [Paenibacillus sp. S-38]|uniref:cellulase family glycosylhydrolase n=1 Tax=Paenibacillus sp. S-38 TaxID=3416710 RepID=UPI003CF4C436
MASQKIKTLLSMLLAITLLLTMMQSNVSASRSSEKKEAKEKNDIQSYVNKMQPGWNLGNTFDATGADETSWGNPRVTKEFIEEIAEQGFKSIRIPITWDQHTGSEPPYTIDPAYLDRVEEVVDWSLDEGLYVMINLHHDSWLWINQMNQPEKEAEILARYKAIWPQIAERFKNHSNKLLFESVNEPRFGSGWGADPVVSNQLVKKLNVSFHEIVRSSGGKNAVRPLVLPTFETSSSQENLDALYSTISGLNDPHLIATVHYYGFWPFSVNIAGFTRFNEETKNDIMQTFDRVHNTLVAKGIPVIVGEYGLLGFDKNTGTIEQGEKLKFFEFLLYYLQSKQITHMLWDNGQHFDRTTYEWKDAELFNMLKASWKGRSATAESDLVYVFKGQEVQDQSIRLDLQGNRLTGLKVSGKQLSKGRDYELEGSVLKLKASLLSKLTASGEFGESAVITAKFNKGADWNFRVLYVDTPVLENTSGTTAAFSIPTTFNGDRLATMEAVYAAGGNAGPQNWTPFKEFAYSFAPSYETNEIKLLENFFKETNDGEVILKFHFWSGKVITYHITKGGTQVTGKIAS